MNDVKIYNIIEKIIFNRIESCDRIHILVRTFDDEYSDYIYINNATSKKEYNETNTMTLMTSDNLQCRKWVQPIIRPSRLALMENQKRKWRT